MYLRYTNRKTQPIALWFLNSSGPFTSNVSFQGPHLCAHQKDAAIALETAIKALGSPKNTEVARNNLNLAWFSGCNIGIGKGIKKNTYFLLHLFSMF